MERKWEEVYDFLSTGKCPPEYDKNKKCNLRRYAAKFTLKEGQIFMGNKRVIRTKDEARVIFNEFHSSPIGGHSGILKTRSAMCSRFYWHGMTLDIDNWVLDCEKCKKVKRPLGAVERLPYKVSTVWELVSIDLTGPFPETASGFQYILTAIDYFSKWVEAFPLKTKLAAEVGPHICSIMYRHGCPKRILSNLGKEFVSELNERLSSLLCIEKCVTAAYHPRIHGLDEKTNANIKRALKKLVNEKQNNWDVYLEATLFSLRSKVQTTTKYSPFLLMYGREAVFPSEVPVNMPLSSILLPEDCSYSAFCDEKKSTMETVNEITMDNLTKSQEKRKRASEEKADKKDQTLTSVKEEELVSDEAADSSNFISLEAYFSRD